MKKLKDANSKYKDLLKMAKGRIQSQEEELEKKKGELFHYITVLYCTVLYCTVLYCTVHSSNRACMHLTQINIFFSFVCLIDSSIH